MKEYNNSINKDLIYLVEPSEWQTQDIRACEKNLLLKFASCRPFSEHLMKWDDPKLKDKYDHNFFGYESQPAEEEFQAALLYQKKEKASFIKLQGYVPLENPFGLEENVCLTMQLMQETDGWKTNPNLTFHVPRLLELKEMERRHYGPLWGEDFAVRNVERLYEKLNYLGAYQNEKLVASCYYFSSGTYTCIDGLITAEEERHKYAATSLLAAVIRQVPGHTVFLHADANDTPKEMYLKMGFQIVDRCYEYMSNKINKNSRKNLKKLY